MKIHLLLPLLMLFIACNGQGKPVSSQVAQNKSINNTQIAEYIVEIFEDSNGNLWFGTIAKGAACYDGKKLSYLSEKDGLAGNTVTSIIEDKQGNLWFGTHTGASRYDGKTFTNFQDNEGLTGAGCYLLLDRKGNIWAGTNDGAFRFNGTSFSKFHITGPPAESKSYKWAAGKVWGLMEDKKGNIWFGRVGFGVCKYDGKTFKHFTKKDGLSSNNVSSICEDNKGNIWFGCLSSDYPKYINEGGLCSYDGKTFTKYPHEGLIDNDIYTIYQDKADNVWIGATGYGAYRYDGTKFTAFKSTDRNDLVPSFGIQSILEDKSGTLWFGFSGGLFRFNGTMFTNVSRQDMQ